MFRVAIARGLIEDAAPMRWWQALFAAMLVLLAAGVITEQAEARRRSGRAFFPPRPERLRAVRYADLGAKECLAELGLREVPYRLPDVHEQRKAPHVDAPVILTGSIRDVHFEFAYPAVRRGPAIMDCRLLLALDDLATVAGDRGITTVRYNSIYRRGWGKRGHRHPAGVAIDVVGFVKQDGQELDILEDFRGHGVGSKTCGDDAPEAPNGKAKELRELVCALHRDHVFNLILSPHYDRRHKNHLHLEVRRGIKWFLTQ